LVRERLHANEVVLETTAVVSGGIARPGALEIFGVRADYDKLAAASPLGHKEQAMPSEIESSVPSSEPVASRREFVAAVTVAAAVGTAGAAQAQTPANPLRYSNPDGMTKPTAYSQVVEVNGPHRIIFIAGQTGVDAGGKAAQGFRAQAMQVFENIKTALNSAGGDFEHVVKITTYLTDIEQNADAYREVRALFFANKATLPASTLLQITRLANPSYLIEVEAMAVLPPKA
jgi:enamine deaminase RidA (YjgF/YER057c/UK114 family)